MPRCPHCRSGRTVSNGVYASRRNGLTKRFVCRACGEQFKQFKKPKSAYAQLGINAKPDEILTGCALIAMGLSFDQAEGLIGVKAETIRQRLLRTLKHPEALPYTETQLISVYGVRGREFRNLTLLLAKGPKDDGTVRGRKFRRSRAESDVALWRRNLRAYDSGKEWPLAWHVTVQFARRAALGKGPKDVQIPHAAVQQARQKIKTRVEAVLGCQLLVTLAGRFYRSEDDPRLERWLKRIRSFPTTENPNVIMALKRIERRVFDEVRGLPAQVQSSGEVLTVLSRKFGARVEGLIDLVESTALALGIPDHLLSEARRPLDDGGPNRRA